MLDDFFQKAKMNGIKFGKPISANDLDSFIPLFVSCINEVSSTTRSFTSDRINIEQVKKIVKLNDAIFPDNKTLTRSSEKDISYLNMFCDEFYTIDNDKIDIDNVDQVIKDILNRVQTRCTNQRDLERFMGRCPERYNEMGLC